MSKRCHSSFPKAIPDLFDPDVAVEVFILEAIQPAPAVQSGDRGGRRQAGERVLGER
jgi:hypothetical protein